MLAPFVLSLLVAPAAVDVRVTPFPLPHHQAAAAQQVKPNPQVKPDQPWPPAGVSRPGGGTTAPKLVAETRPHYSAAAMNAKIQGVVLLEAIILPDGKVGEVRVARSLDKEHGLDDEAVRAIKKWRFEAGKRDGVAVPVLVEIEMTFTLRK